MVVNFTIVSIFIFSTKCFSYGPKVFFPPRVLRKRGFARVARRRRALQRLYRSHRLFFKR